MLAGGENRQGEGDHFETKAAPQTASPRKFWHTMLISIDRDNLVNILLFLEAPDVLSLLSISKDRLKATRHDAILWTLLCERDICQVQRFTRFQFGAVLSSLGAANEASALEVYCSLNRLGKTMLPGCYRMRGTIADPRGGLFLIRLPRDRMVMDSISFDRGSTPIRLLLLASKRGISLEGHGIDITQAEGGSNLLTFSSSDSGDPLSLKLRGQVIERINLKAAGTFPPKLRALAERLHCALHFAWYGPHGLEVIQTRVEHNINHGWMLLGDKIQGDPNVPAGELSFKMDLSTSVSRLDPLLTAQISPQRREHVECVINGHGQINPTPGEWENASFIPAHFILYRQGSLKETDHSSPMAIHPLTANKPLSFSVLWQEDGHTLDYISYDVIADGAFDWPK